MKPAFLLLIAAWNAAAVDRFEITLRLPPGGLYAREEMQIEFRVEDTTRPDPLGAHDETRQLCASGPCRATRCPD